MLLNQTHTIRKVASIEEMTSRDFLTSIFGEISSIEKQPMKTMSSFSGSRHQRIILHYENLRPVSLVLKIVSPSKDMTIWRSGNFPNREASLVGCAELNGLWDILHCPYLGYCSEEEDSALLMNDLSAHLFPDVREAISMEQEDLILQSLAKMHARYWQRDLKCTPWLLKQEMFFSFLGPQAPDEEKKLGRGHPILDAVRDGWKLVGEILPTELTSFIMDPPIEKFTAGLPKTLIHGDSKLGNLAIVPGRRLSAFDWTVVAYACPAVEIGWYIAVNSSRLATTKENFIDRYKELLEQELQFQFDHHTWQRMVDLAILTGVRMLLWNKAMNVQKSLPNASAEWDWWVERISECSARQA